MMQAQEAMDANQAWDYSSEIKTILSKLGINDTTKPVNQLSGGQQKRVGLAKTLIEQPDLLLLDEPTNHLDFESINWLINYVKQYPHTVLFVTHDRYFLNEVSSRIIELTQGKLKRIQGIMRHILSKELRTKSLSKSNKLSNAHCINKS